MLNSIKKYIQRNRLLSKEHQHLVALSGGADSVCLLLVMKELGYDVQAVHCNFNLRGEESNRDEQFCKELCENIGIKLYLTHFDTKSYASLHKISIEMAARDLRYNYFEQLRIAINAEDILVAHHRDDNIETFLLNILRGTGVNGLCGMKPRNGHIVRPLLSVSRQQIEDYLTLRHQSYVTDSSNLVDDVVRNKIRLNLLPLMETINPSVRKSIANTIRHVSEAIGQEKRNDIDKHETGGEQELFNQLFPLGFSPAQIEQIYGHLHVLSDNSNTASDQTLSGKVWFSATHAATIDRGRLIVEEKGDSYINEENKPLVINASPLMDVPDTPLTYIYNERAKVGVSFAYREDSFAPSRDANIATLDADKIKFPLKIRRVEAGDRFRPYGMRGSKLVSDYLTDRKRNIFQKRQQLVLTDASGSILWLLGERVSQDAAITEKTINIITMRYITDEE
ncbi:MAG: tRNA lysidine(34) synthetase TilS [Prevotella sp.]|nr:tRNA lysidine(34) synthetase TilS [Candidatus Prevotella equi]